MVEEGYVEGLLLWSEGGSSLEAARWCSERGLRCLPMRAGLLISGDRDSFERAFAVDLKEVEPPVSLPVPAELRGIVSSIAIPSPRQIRG